MDFGSYQDALGDLFGAIQQGLRSELTTVWLPLQLGLIAIAGGVALAATSTLHRHSDVVAATATWPPMLRAFTRGLARHCTGIVFVLLLAITRAVLRAEVEQPHTYLLLVTINLMTAWLVINVLTSVIHNQFLNRVVTIASWTIAALSILRLLEPVTASLDSNAVSLSVGGLRISPLLVIKTTALLLVTLWIANILANFVDRRVKDFDDLTPSIQVLISKLIRIALITLAVVIVLNSVGIDLSVLALFSGAVGLGLGFGLQKIVSNLVSGIILLADKSIKPGDIISVGDHFGRVGNMGARYTSVDTRDGREYLIPNEDFITQRVANWTYSSDYVRLEVKFNTTYDSDPRKVIETAIAAALGVERVARKPAPACMVSAFGAAALEFELWFWINNPSAGVNNVKSDVLLSLWDALDAQGAKLAKPGPARVIYEMAGEQAGASGPLPKTKKDER
ncbi:MAG: Potassium efflux system KefA protein / Small-conductance mechanosensitive channel [Pseudolabrys sp.]|jgi:small-conductance mechanosensitive channel|nr:Potassium efflux system KefA protein / Small-conductance mechanosensitive channel [Pseudolabrys sp.]